MSPLSKWRLSAEEEKKVNEVLVSELVKFPERDEMKLVVDMLLSKTEKLMIGKRILVLVLIKKGYNNTDIAKQLHLTRATVDRLRVNFFHLESKKEPVRLMAGKMENRMVKMLLKKFINYAVPAAFGRIPR
jgi:hypothetical protein